MLDCLRQKSAGEIVETQKVAIDFPNLVPFSPTMDGFFLTDSPQNLLATGSIKDVPVLIGSNENEGNWYAFTFTI